MGSSTGCEAMPSKLVYQSPRTSCAIPIRRQLTEAGMPVTSLGKLLGHAQVSTTQIYTVGADPELAQAYQQAIQRLSAEPLPSMEKQGQHVFPPPVASIPIQQRQDCEVNWAGWIRIFPWLCEKQLWPYVKRCQPRWKANRRGKQSRKVLGEFHRFWSRQMQLRPIQQPGELTLQDLHNFQALKDAEGATSRTADYTISLVIHLLRELADQGRLIQASVLRLSPARARKACPGICRRAKHNAWNGTCSNDCRPRNLYCSWRMPVTSYWLTLACGRGNVWMCVCKTLTCQEDA